MSAMLQRDINGRSPGATPAVREVMTELET